MRKCCITMPSPGGFTKRYFVNGTDENIRSAMEIIQQQQADHAGTIMQWWQSVDTVLAAHDIVRDAH